MIEPRRPCISISRHVFVHDGDFRSVTHVAIAPVTPLTIARAVCGVTVEANTVEQSVPAVGVCERCLQVIGAL